MPNLMGQNHHHKAHRAQSQQTQRTSSQKSQFFNNQTKALKSFMTHHRELPKEDIVLDQTNRVIRNAEGDVFARLTPVLGGYTLSDWITHPELKNHKFEGKVKRELEQETRPTPLLTQAENRPVISDLAPVETLELDIKDIFIALNKKDYSTLRALKTNLPQINDTNSNSETPLQKAFARNDIAAMRILLKKGADPNIKNTEGTPLLVEALAKQQLDMAALLLNSGANTNLVGSDGVPPLSKALLFEQKNIALLLIQKGADILLKDPSGDSPWKLAKDDGDRTVLATMIKAAIKSHNTQTLTGLIDLGVDLSAQGWLEPEQINQLPLEVVKKELLKKCQTGPLRAVRRILDHYKGISKETLVEALNTAVAKKNVQIQAFIIEKGQLLEPETINLLPKETIITVLHQKIEQGDLESIRKIAGGYSDKSILFEEFEGVSPLQKAENQQQHAVAAFIATQMLYQAAETGPLDLVESTFQKVQGYVTQAAAGAFETPLDFAIVKAREKGQAVCLQFLKAEKIQPLDPGPLGALGDVPMKLFTWDSQSHTLTDKGVYLLKSAVINAYLKHEKTQSLDSIFDSFKQQIQQLQPPTYPDAFKTALLEYLEEGKKRDELKDFIATKPNLRTTNDHVIIYTDLNGQSGKEEVVILLTDGEYRGQYLDCKMEGQGTQTLLKGGQCEGQFKSGKLNGMGKKTYPDQSTDEGIFHNGFLHGHGTRTNKDGSTLTGEFSGGRIVNGEGEDQDSDGTVRIGTFRNGKLEGYGRSSNSKGTLYEGEFENGKEHGQGTLTFTDGCILKGRFFQGTIHRASVVTEGSKARIRETLLNKSGVNLHYNSGLGAQAIAWLKNDIQATPRNTQEISEHESDVLDSLAMTLEHSTHIAQMLTDEKISEINQARKTHAQLIHGGWKRHAVTFLLDGDNLLICNKGQGLVPSNAMGKCQSILHLKLTTDESVAEALKLIKAAKGKAYDNGGYSTIYRDILELPGVQVPHYFQSQYNVTHHQDPTFLAFNQEQQHRGNCWFMSPRTATYGLMVLRCLEKVRAHPELCNDYLDNLVGQPTEQNILDAARKMARILYKKSFSVRASLNRIQPEEAVSEEELLAHDQEDDVTG